MTRTLAVFFAGIAVVVLLGTHSVQNRVPMNFSDAAALGLIGSAITTVNKFGESGVISTSEESIWDAGDLPSAAAGPARCFVNRGVTAAAMNVSSDDATDAGLGISIEVLDSTWTRSIITMNLGVTATTTGTVYEPIGSATLLRVNRAFATGDAFTGNIYIHTDVDDNGTDGVPDLPSGQIIAVITAGEDQTLQACYTVPLGYSALMKTFHVSNTGLATPKFVTFRIRKSVAGAAARTQKKFTLLNGVSEEQNPNPPILFTEKTDIEITAIGEGTAAATGTFDIILFPNSMF
jgi:hypothetical protein